MSTENWKKDAKESWFRSSKNFSVEIVHWQRTQTAMDREEGPHKWNVYAYIHEGHPLHAKIRADGGWYQDALALIPLHGGVSFLQGFYGRNEWSRTEVSRVMTWKVGGDYGHVDDVRFTHYETLEDAREVVRDADELFRWLEGDATAGRSVEVSTLQVLHAVVKAQKESGS